MTRTEWFLLARMTWREWFGRPPARGYPGRRVVAHVGLLEVERMFGGDLYGFSTGERLRRSGATLRARPLDRLRLVVPWRGGQLWISVAPDTETARRY